jgi:hypothetical protein
MDKIISYKKLEGLNKKDLDIQQKIYKKEVAYYKGFKKKYLDQKYQYLNFLPGLKQLKESIIVKLNDIKKYVYLDNQFYLLKDFFLFNKVIVRFHFKIYKLKKKEPTLIIKKQFDELIKKFNSKQNIDFVKFFSETNAKIKEEISFHKFKFEDIFNTKDMRIKFNSFFEQEKSDLFYSIADIDLNINKFLGIDESSFGLYWVKNFSELKKKNEFASKGLYKFNDLTPCSENEFKENGNVITEVIAFNEMYDFPSISDEVNNDLVPFILEEFDIDKFEKYLFEYNNKNLRKIELINRSRKSKIEKQDNFGYVYVLSNKALPINTYKIGSTYGLPEKRAEELTGTGHLYPFKVLTKKRMQNAEYYEKTIHKILDKYRVKKDREFFNIKIDRIKICLNQIYEISDRGQLHLKLSDIKKKIKINEF